MVLPGLMCDSRMFAGQTGSIAEVVVIDGFYEGASSLEAMADHALAHMPGRANLLGHSMGARIALEIMRKAPDRVARLALANTGTHPVRPGEREKRYALRDIGRDQGMESLVDHWLPPMLAPAARSDKALVQGLRAMCIDAGLAVFEAQIEALLARRDGESVLRAITCPTYAITGSEDMWSPPGQHEQIVSAIPGAQLRVIEGAGHMLPAERPQEFNAVLREWLSQPIN